MTVRSREIKYLYTRIWQRLITVFAALFIISNSVSVFAGSADTLPQENPDMPASSEAPPFTAHIEWTHNGYVAKGTFTEFPSDIILVQPLYSLDGETWEVCEVVWDLHWLEVEDAGALERLQNQVCLYQSHEPLSSYLAGSLDRFYLKLRLVKENGSTYETQAAIIDRGDVQEVPAEMNLSAAFSPALLVRETRPFRYYGRYQLTVSEDAAPEDISACLPDTLPVRISLQSGIDFVADGIVDCPVTWKPLSLPQLIAGESITVLDAAEEIVIPGGTLLRTPLGIFRLNEPIGIDQYGLSDEVRLVLNVVGKDESPTGALSAENDGLEMAFHLKPTGATAIRAYVLSQGQAEWTELAASSLLDAVNAQPSTAGSGYAFVLSSSEEPYRSYLAAESAAADATPFLIGLKIEGGVYDGRQLILAWPDTYECPAQLPSLGGAGGNEGNAGASNSGDSTAEGQRPGLPQEPEDKAEILDPDPTPIINSSGDNQQDQDDRQHLGLDSATEPPTAAQAVTDVKTGKKSPATNSAAGEKTGAPTNVTRSGTSSPEHAASAAPSSPDKDETANLWEAADSDAAAGGPNWLLLAVVSGICIIAAAGKVLTGIISHRMTK